jgi:hypothetical protein
MAPITATASRIHGHTGVEEAAGAGEVVAVGTTVAALGELDWGAGVVVVVVVEVEVFVAVLVVEVFVGALVVEIGVRDGRVGRLSEREALGRFEPPPHAAIKTRAIARSAIEESLVLLASLLYLP